MEHPAVVIAALSCTLGGLGCEALLDFEGLEWVDESAATGGAAGAAVGGEAGTGGGGGGTGGVAGDCLVDASRSDDFLSISHTEDLWRTLEIGEPDTSNKVQDATGIGRLFIIPREWKIFERHYLGSLTYQDVCGDFGFIVIGHADDGMTPVGPAPPTDSGLHGIGVMIRDPNDEAHRWVILRSNWVLGDYMLYGAWNALVEVQPGIEEPRTTLIPEAYAPLTDSLSDYAMMVCRIDRQVHLLHKRTAGGAVTVYTTVSDYDLPERVQVGFAVERSSNEQVRGSFSSALFDNYGSLASCQSALEAALE